MYTYIYSEQWWESINRACNPVFQCLHSLSHCRHVSIEIEPANMYTPLCDDAVYIYIDEMCLFSFYAQVLRAHQHQWPLGAYVWFECASPCIIVIRRRLFFFVSIVVFFRRKIVFPTSQDLSAAHMEYKWERASALAFVRQMILIETKQIHAFNCVDYLHETHDLRFLSPS